MRIFCYLLLINFANEGLTQFINPDSVWTENHYSSNGKIRLVADYCLIDNQVTLCGRYEEYDTLGHLLVKGQYRVAADSLDCFNCFHLDYRDSSLHQYFKSDWCELRVGMWNFYYPNGQIRECGEYSMSVHEEWSTCLFLFNSNSTIYGPCANGYHAEYLKSGYWNYYDENGQQVSRVYYSEGFIIETAYVNNE